MKCIIQRPSVGAEPYVNLVADASINRVDDTWGILESIKVEAQFSASVMPREFRDLPVVHKGYCDTHLHGVWMASQMGKLSLRGLNSIDAIFNALLKAHREQPRAGYIQAFDWDHEACHVSPELLAQDFALFCQEQGIECVALRVCGHMGLVSAGLASRWGLGNACLIRDAQLEVVHQKLFRWNRDESAQLFEITQEALLSKGITAVSEMSMHTGQVEGLLALTKKGKLKINVQGVLDHEVSESIFCAGPFVESNASNLGPLGVPAQLQVRHVKRFLDGSIGARTAWLKAPYDDEESFGDSLCQDQDLFAWAESALKNGWLLSFHAIGDGALEQICRLSMHWRDQLKAAVKSESSSFFKSAAWHRIEHAQVMGDFFLHHLVSQQMWSFLVQPYHRISDQDFAIKRLGPVRFYNEAYRLRSIFSLLGSRVGLGSDAPVAEWSPVNVLRASMSHPNPLERVDWLTAVWLYTTGAKLCLGLDPGKLSAGSTVVISDPIE